MTALPILFTRTACADSLRARTWLVKQGIAFAEYDIERDVEAARERFGVRVTAAPLLLAGRAAVLGYRPDAFVELIAATQPGEPRRWRHGA
jgi:glutaredoxin